MTKHLIIIWLIFLGSVSLMGQQARRVLFLGNSYTQVNDLPQILTDVAASVGDSVVTDQSTPGGYTLQLHTTNATSLNKIMTGGWDFVVLQEQSQLPSFPINQVMTDVYPYARFLDSLVNAHNPCAETVFYRTWGRKNGDASNCSWWPPVCTYQGMDSLLQLRYMMLADSNEAIVSPVGAVWKYIRQNYPGIELYQMDESHPSQAGSYAAACCFYTTLFRKNPLLISYNYTLSESDAHLIRTAVRQVVYSHLIYWHIGEYDPVSDFSHELRDDLRVAFTNLSQEATNFVWDFGDGEQSTEMNPEHTYPASGTYEVQLVANHCSLADTAHRQVFVILTDVNRQSTNPPTIYPNPVTNKLQVKMPDGKLDRITLFDASGNALPTQLVNHNQQLVTLDFSQILPGSYFLQVEINQVQYTFKVLKK